MTRESFLARETLIKSLSDLISVSLGSEVASGAVGLDCG